MAIGISSTGFGARAQGFDTLRAEPVRRREAPEAREALAAVDPEREDTASAAVFQRVPAIDESRAARGGRVLGAEPATDAFRPGVSAYLSVQRGTVTDPSGGELVGIDIYV